VTPTASGITFLGNAVLDVVLPARLVLKLAFAFVERSILVVNGGRDSRRGSTLRKVFYVHIFY
jgi:hypothetical protein